MFVKLEDMLLWIQFRKALNVEINLFVTNSYATVSVVLLFFFFLIISKTIIAINIKGHDCDERLKGFMETLVYLN